MKKRLCLLESYNGKRKLAYISTGKYGRATPTGEAESNLALGERCRVWVYVDCLPVEDIYSIVKDDPIFSQS